MLQLLNRRVKGLVALDVSSDPDEFKWLKAHATIQASLTRILAHLQSGETERPFDVDPADWQLVMDAAREVDPRIDGSPQLVAALRLNLRSLRNLYTAAPAAYELISESEFIKESEDERWLAGAEFRGLLSRLRDEGQQGFEPDFPDGPDDDPDSDEDDEAV